MILSDSRHRILAVIVSGAILIAIDGSTIYPILASIRDFFGVSESLVVWTFNIEILCLMLATPLFATMLDIRGRKQVYTAAALSFLAGTIIVTVSQSFPVFLSGRALQGIGATLSFISIIIIGDNFTEKRGTVLGIFGVVIGIVYAAGPLISGYLVTIDWHYVFVLNIPVAAVVVCLGYFLLPEDTMPVRRVAVDWKGMGLLGLSIAAFTVFINEYSGSAARPVLWLLPVLCVICLLAFWYTQRRSKEKILPLDLFRKKNVAIAGIVTLVGYLAAAGTYFLSTYAIIAFGLDYSEGAYILLPFTVSSLLATMAVGRLLDIVGPRPIMFAGGLLSVAGTLMLSCLGADSIGMFVVAIVLIGTGNASVAGNALYYIWLRESGTSDRASGQGMQNLLLNAGALIGGALLGGALNAGVDTTGPFRAIYGILALVYLVLTLLVLGIEKTDKHRSEGPAPG